MFGERLYVAGRLGTPDGYEQPFHSLDFTYSWYPTEFITVKAKLRNMLDGMVEIEREGVVVFSERPGNSASLSFKWEFRCRRRTPMGTRKRLRNPVACRSG